MIELIKQYVIKQYAKRRNSTDLELRELSTIPTLHAKSENLRRLDTDNLTEIFTSAGIQQDWSKTEEELLRICQIEDGVTGGVNPGDRRAIWYLITGFAPASVLEIGTHVGASTVHIAMALRNLMQKGSSIKPRLVTVDIQDVNHEITGYWRKYGIKMSPKGMIQAAGCQDIVTFVKDTSVAYLDHSTARFDFIFLDGNHAAQFVYQEIPRALNRLNKGGIILLHDYFPENRPLWPNGSVIPGPHIGVNRLKREGCPITPIPLGNLPWYTKLGTKTTSLAILSHL